MGVSFSGYRPGALGIVCALHAEAQAINLGFGRAFECKVAGEMAEFLDRFDPAWDLFLLATDDADGRIVGSITIDGEERADGFAHLRWFVVEPGSRGRGIGKALLDRAIAFLHERAFARCYLTTVEPLRTAGALYVRAGFAVVHEEWASSWGTPCLEQRVEGVVASLRSVS